MMRRASWPMLLAAAPLAVWGMWVLWTAVQGRQWAMGLVGVIAVAVAAGLLLLKVWAKYLAYLFATGLALSWIYAVWLSVARGWWPYPDRLTTVLSLIPGACLLVVCVGGAYVIHRQYRSRVRET
jgi:hypothetical protein